MTLWIAADWGTSNLRLWAIGPDGKVLAERQSGDGMGGLSPDQFEPALLRLCGDLLPDGQVTDVLICGMAGARQGWTEAPYTKVPCPPMGAAPVIAPTLDARLSVRILPGLFQTGPNDVMRGEETQIAGFLASRPDFDGCLCLPGSHTKWVRLSHGTVHEFRTAMTGEMFAALSRHTVLRHSVEPGPMDSQTFATAVTDAVTSPPTLTLDLFTIRPDSLIDGTPGHVASARLSGLLVGAELAGTRRFWEGRDTVVIGSPSLTDHYVTALKQVGANAAPADMPDLALRGLMAARLAQPA